MRKENDKIKNRLQEIEKINDEEFDALKKKLNQVHDAELEEVKLSNVKLMECLQSEISKLEAHLKAKNDEMAQLIKEKTATRQGYEAEIRRQQEEILVANKNLKEIENVHSITIEDYEKKVRDL